MEFKILKEYLWAVCQHWYGLVPGVFAGIFGLLQMAYPDMSVPWWLLSFICFFGLSISQFLAWRDVAKQRDKYKRMLRPKFKIFCDKDGCRKKTQFSVHVGGGDVIYFRLNVQNAGGNTLKNCRAFLIGMKKNGAPLEYGERTPLVWAGPKATDEQIDIQARSDTFLDLVRAFRSGSGGGQDFETSEQAVRAAIENVGAEIVTGNVFLKSVSGHHKFSEPGQYALTVRISSDDTTSITKEILFDYTGNWETSELKCYEANA
jgi:hypothetical protein